MATEITTTVVDDLDESTDDVQTCYLALGEAAIYIDLSEPHRVELEEFLDRYFQVGRAADVEKPGRSTGKTAAPVRNDRERLVAIRAWARHNGYTISDRGRISVEITTAYDAAH